jgi:nicotinate phosphoribosyltransferase
LRDVAGADATLLEFGTRRAFSPQAAIWAARAAIAGGLDTTSNVLAALKLGYQPSGTMAHALVMAIGAKAGSETAAFEAFHRYFPGAPLLIDTYDSISAAKRLATQVAAGEIELAGIRLDSGDLISLSKQVNAILPNVDIFASGDLDEWEIAKLRAAQAPISGYGLGTKLVTGSPVNGVYKLVEIDNLPTMKRSANKMTYPGKKQIFRHTHNGKFTGDTLGLMAEGRGLLELVMSQGARLQADDDLATIRSRTDRNVASLTVEIRDINYDEASPVNISPLLTNLTQSLLDTIP